MRYGLILLLLAALAACATVVVNQGEGAAKSTKGVINVEDVDVEKKK